MGLDIVVYKPYKKLGTIDLKEDDFFLLDECPELKTFESLAVDHELGYFDIEKGLEALGFKEEDLDWNGTEYAEVVTYKYVHKTTKQRIFLKDPPKVAKTQKILLVREVGYQRKGANQLFYDEDNWAGPCILDKETLLKHRDRYFSDTPEMRENFERNILDNFVEGLTFVCYC